MALLMERVPPLGEVVSGGPLPEPWHSEFNGCVLCAETTVWGLLLKSGDHVPMCSSCQNCFLRRPSLKYDVVDTSDGMVDYLVLNSSKLRRRFVLFSAATLGGAMRASMRLVAGGFKNITIVRVETKADRSRSIYPEVTYRAGRARRAAAPA